MNTKHLLAACFMLLNSYFSFAQIPQGFNYQAIIRDGSGEPMVNQNVTLRFSIWQQGWPDENIEYQETHTTTTNEFGMVNRVVGQGTPTEGSWNNIEWHQPYSQLAWLLRVEVNTGNGFVDLGSQQFSSVPYAELAKNNWSLHGNADTDPATHYIGTTDYTPLNFRTNNQTRMTIDDYGAVGIGTIPSGKYVDISVPGGDLGMRLKSTLDWAFFDIDGHSGVAGINFLGDGVSVGSLTAYASSQKLNLTCGSADLDLEGSSGNIGINNPGAALASLHVEGGVDADLATDASGYLIIGNVASSNIVMDNNEIISRNNGAVDELFLNAEGGGVVINSASSTSHELFVNGTAAKPGGGDWSMTSDARLKENVQPFTSGLDDVMKISPVTYHYIEQTGHDTSVEHVGVIAQDLQKISPNMVSESEMELVDGTKGNYLSVDPSAFTYMLINSIQEQQKQIEAQQKQIDELRKEVAGLKSR